MKNPIVGVLIFFVIGLLYGQYFAPWAYTVLFLVISIALVYSLLNKNIIGIIQSFLILILVVLVIFMMIQISRLQGTARVINYAGLVRGATQREVKLEITGNQNDELIKYLDDILLGLRYQDGHYNLVKLNDEEYQGKLKIQSDYWDKLKQ